jgi:PAS domain S-box-containing protein
MNNAKIVGPRARKSNHRPKLANGSGRNRTTKANGRTETAMIDLRHRKAAEAAVSESEKRYRTLFDLVPVAVYACDANGVIQEYNDHAVELWGREPGRNGAKPRFCGSFRIYYPDGRPMSHEECPMARALRGEKLEPKDLEIIVERPDGERRNVILAPRIIKDRRGKVVGAINCLYDTEHKRAEAAELRLAAVVQSSHDAIVAKDVNGIITDWNKSAERIFGYSAEEIIGKSILTLIPQERQNEEAAILKKVRSGQSIDHYETVRRRKDGTLLNVSLTISPIRDTKGKITGISKIAQDVTRQKAAEQRLAEQARLLDLTHDAIIVRDRQDRIVYWSKGAEEIYGYTREKALGKITHQLLKTQHPQSWRSIREKLERDNRWSGELKHIRRDGTQITVLSRWSLDRKGHGRELSILETNTDITELKKAETELQKSKELLEQLVRHRTKALRAANSELQSEIARRKGLEGQILEISDREQERLGQELHDGLCQQLTAIGFLARATALRLRDHRVVQTDHLEKIAQLINASVMDARNIARDLHKEEIDAAGLLPALHDLAERKIWKTPCRLDIKTELNIERDDVASQLYRILREAVINANKHARANEIVLEVRRRENELIFSVSDNGVGIDVENKENQGLGFHIMRYRAESIGARLELQSPRKGGTRVVVYLSQQK